MKPSEILDKAAEIIERDGWIQGKYYQTDRHNPKSDQAANEHGPCCQAGAISRAAYGTAWASYAERADNREAQEASSRADRYMRLYLVREGKAVGEHASPIEWNDRPNRTADEVTAALRGAAEMARTNGD